MTMYFVVRTDVSADSGMQRCFGASDTEAEARRLIADLEAHMRGTFEVFEGKIIPK